MADMDEHERKVVNEFCHLLEKSKQLFNGLRDLPQYGHKQWQAYFGRTFDIYTKLWKFQQQHRQVLDSKYGLKRWQIGEIASKIGQLYYHYYLRTSETNYLNEAFSFYAAIRGRAYYSRTTKDDRGSELMVKKLRYYARFIVVCLLLKRMKLVRDLVRELSQQIEEYASTYAPEDQLEWSLVLGEIRSFIDADNAINVLDMDSNTIVLSHRLSSHTTPPLEKTPPVSLTLQEILIVGNCSDQVKFSELTIDMFRMLQTLEREPLEDVAHLYDTSPASTKIPYNGETSGRLSKRENPHKYLLYKPTFSQLLVFLSSGFKELPANGVMLLYISADGSYANPKHSQESGFDYGGVVTNSKRDNEHQHHQHNQQQNNKRTGDTPVGLQLRELHCLYPGDLTPFTRKPLFLVVDSDNSLVFSSLVPMFGQPLVVLMSPVDCPHQFQEEHQRGNIFSLFLHCPLMGLCVVSSVCDVPMLLWEKCQALVDRFILETSRLLTRARNLDPAYIHFLSDDFLRLLILRYIFCTAVLRAHRAFKSARQYPRCNPALPEPEVKVGCVNGGAGGDGGGGTGMLFGEVTRLTDWFGSLWLRYSDGSRKLMHYAANEITQVSVRGHVLGESGSDIRLVSARQSTTYKKDVPISSEHSVEDDGDGLPQTTSKELRVISSITWSPLPPRRATTAAAQSLCVTLYCDDTLDDFMDISSPVICTRTAAASDSKILAKSSVAKSLANVNNLAELALPGNLRSRQNSASHRVAFQLPVRLQQSPHVSLRSTPNIGKSSTPAVLSEGLNVCPPLDSPPTPPVPSFPSVRPSLSDYHSPLDNTNSPLHISHTLLSPPLSGIAHRPSLLKPPPLSIQYPSTTLERKFPPLSSSRASFTQSSDPNSVDGMSSGRQRARTIGHRNRASDKEKLLHPANTAVSIASMTTSSAVTDASLTAHLPPWHSIGNISLSYLVNQNDEKTSLNMHLPGHTESNNSVENMNNANASCPCFPPSCKQVSSACIDQAVCSHNQQSVITNQNDVLRLDACHCPNILPSDSGPSCHLLPSNYAANDQLTKPMVLPLKDTQQPLSVRNLPSYSDARLDTHAEMPKSLHSESAMVRSRKQLSTVEKTVKGIPRENVAYPAASPTDSILSSGLVVTSSATLPEKPSTHPTDTPTEQPSNPLDYAAAWRRFKTKTSAQDLRLQSIHDLNWLTAMEPEEQVLLEVHVIWSILTLMVVLLTCYSIHNPLAG